MDMRPFVIPAVFVVLVATACTGAAERTPAAEPAAVTTDSFAVVACSPAVLRAARDPLSAILHRAAAGDTLRAWNETRLVSPGVVVFRGARPVTVTPEPEGVEMPGAMRFAAGDTLFLLDYQSEGRWSVRAGELTFTVAEFWDGMLGGAPGQGSPVTDSSAAVALSLPVYDAWLRVRLPDGRLAWWQRDSAEALQSVEHLQKWGQRCGASAPPAAAGPPQSSEYPYDPHTSFATQQVGRPRTRHPRAVRQRPVTQRVAPRDLQDAIQQCTPHRHVGPADLPPLRVTHPPIMPPPPCRPHHVRPGITVPFPGGGWRRDPPPPSRRAST